MLPLCDTILLLRFKCQYTYVLNAGDTDGRRIELENVRYEVRVTRNIEVGKSLNTLRGAELIAHFNLGNPKRMAF